MKALYLMLSLFLSFNSLCAIEPIFEKNLDFIDYPYLEFSDDFNTLVVVSGHRVEFFDTKTWSVKNSFIVPDSIRNYFEVTTDGKYLISLYNESTIPELPLYHLKTYTIPNYILIQDHEFIGGGFPYIFRGIETISSDSFFLMTYSTKELITRGEATRYSGFNYNPYTNTLNLIDIGEINATNNIGSKFIGSNVIHSKQDPAGDGYFISSTTINSYFFEKNGRNMKEIKPIDFYHAKILSDNKLLRLLDSNTIIYSDSNSIISIDKIRNQKSNYFYTSNLFDFHIYEDKHLIFAFLKSSDKDSLYILHFPTRMILDKYEFQGNIMDMYVSSSADSIYIFETDGHMTIFSLKSFMNQNPIDIACDRRETTVNQNIKFYPLYYVTCKSYKWDFGDGTISNEKEPIHVYKSPGKFSVSLDVQLLDDTYKKIVKNDFINVYDIILESSPQINLLWANEVTSYSGDNFQYSLDGKTLGYNSLDNILYIFNSQTGNLSFEKKYPESITSCLLADNNNLVLIPYQNHNDEDNKDRLLRINLSNNSMDSIEFVRKSCKYDFIYTNNREYNYMLVPTPDAKIANLLFKIYCANVYDFMSEDLIYNFDFNNKNYLQKNIGIENIFDKRTTFFTDWIYIYHYGSKFYKFDVSLWMTTQIAQYNERDIYPDWIATKYHNNDLLVYDCVKDGLWLYFKTIDSSWTTLKSIKDTIYKFQNIRGTDNFLMIGKNGTIIIFDPEKDSILQRIRVMSELENLAISPTDSQFSVITTEGAIYTFTSSLINQVEPNPNNKNMFVFPNPASDKIKIVLNEELLVNMIQIFSLLGELIIETETKSEIDISSLPIGAYFLRVGNNFSKFVKITR